MSLNQFKFFQKKPDRVFTQWIDEMDDYHLGGIRHTERSEPIHIAEIMGEMINSIQVLNEQVRNNT